MSGGLRHFAGGVRDFAAFCFGGDAAVRCGIGAAFALVLAASWQTCIYTQADDAFYYYKCALGLWQEGFVTFDGFTPTNGVQPLWFLVNVALAGPLVLLQREDLLPQVAVAFSALLAIATQQALYGALRAVLRVPIVRAAAAFILGGTTFFGFDGMEGTLSVFLAVLTIAYLAYVYFEGVALSPTLLALLSLALFLARIDHALLLVLLYAFALGFCSFRRLVAAGLLFLAFCTPYLVYNYATQGSVEPISGRVKQFWADLRYREADGLIPRSPAALVHSKYAAKQLRCALAEFDMAFLVGAKRAFGGYLPIHFESKDLERNPTARRGIAAVAFAVISVGLVVAYRGLRRHPRGSHRFVLGISVCLLLFYVAQLLYYFVLQSSYYPWYSAAGRLAFAVILAPLLLLFPASMSGRFGHKAYVVFIVAFALSWAAWGRGSSRTLAATYDESSFQGLCERLAELVNEKTPQDARIGAWTAGIIGWAVGRDTVNLEGLIEDDAMLVQQRKFQLARVLIDKKIDFIAQHFPPATLELNPRRARELDSFNDLRVRPLIDYPEAFTAIASAENNWSRGWLWAVNRDKLAGLVETEQGLRDALAGTCRVIPAEDASAVRAGTFVIAHRATHGYAVTAGELRYDVADEMGGLLYARVLRPAGGKASLKLKVGNTASEVPVELSGQWQTVRLGQMSTGEKWTVEDIRRGFDPKHPEDRSIYIDELYLVSPENETQAQAAFAALDAFTARGATQGAFPGLEGR